jgi:predicted site-specific integrase-resolvase
MSIPVQATIKALTPKKVAAATGFPVWTLYRWMREDRIPGVGKGHEIRVAQFEAACKRITPRKRQRKAAA